MCRVGWDYKGKSPSSHMKMAAIFYLGPKNNLFVNFYRKKEHDTTPLFIKKIMLQIINFTRCLGYNFFISRHYDFNNNMDDAIIRLIISNKKMIDSARIPQIYKINNLS